MGFPKGGASVRPSFLCRDSLRDLPTEKGSSRVVADKAAVTTSVGRNSATTSNAVVAKVKKDEVAAAGLNEPGKCRKRCVSQLNMA
jgi:hypothetical protein